MTAALEENHASLTQGQRPSKLETYSWPRGAILASWAILCAGAIFRLARFAAHPRALWLDELYLADSILNRGYHDLLMTNLSHWQAAPAGFLWMTRTCVTWFGPGERALRLTSLLFGLASLPLFYGVVRRCFLPLGGLVALAMFAALGPLIYYSNELKQYSCDVMVTLAIVLAMMRWLEKPTTARLITAALAGALGTFFSHPALFVMSGVGAAALILLRRDGKSQQLRLILPILAAWIFAEIINYALFLAPLAHGQAHPHLVQYWVDRHAFMPLMPWWAVAWLFNRLWAICQDPGAMWITYPDAALAALLIGIAAIWRRPGRAMLLALSPIPFALLASAAKQYPFGDRLILYLVPALLMVMAAGIELLWRATPRGLAGIVVLAMVLLPSLWRATGYLFHPPGREETLAAYQWVARHWQPGDALYLSHDAKLSFDHYEPQAGFAVDPKQNGSVLLQTNYDQDPRGYLQDAKRVAGRPRVWVVFTHRIYGPAPDAQQCTLMGLDDIGLRQPAGTFYAEGAAVFLYDCAEKPAPPVITH